MRATYDVKEAERLFVIEDKSYRDIGQIMGVSHSAVASRGTREDWKGKRLAYQAAIARRSYESMAQGVAHQQSQIRDESIAVARGYLRRFAEQLAADKIATNAKDASEMIKLLANVLSPVAEDGGVSAPRVIDGIAVSPTDPELLRRVVELARERVAPTGSVGPGLLVEPANPRPD